MPPVRSKIAFRSKIVFLHTSTLSLTQIKARAYLRELAERCLRGIQFGAIRLLAPLNLGKFADSASDLRQLASD